MIDIQPDSPVPVPEQITSQLTAQIASGALKAGAALPEYRAFAQQLLTNPQVVAKAYADLEWEGVLKKSPTGGMEVTADAAIICRIRQQRSARHRLGQAIREGLASGLGDTDIRQAVEQELANASKEPVHVSGHRDSQGIQVLSRQAGLGPAQPDRAPGSHIRPPRR
jgi:GntR family transcriptional regulator